MKLRFSIFILFIAGMQLSTAQTNLVSHYEAFYKQMKKQGDIQGIVSALTHLIVLQPNEARKDTLAYLYMNENKYVQALNTIGTEIVPGDSDLRVEIKAVSLKAINQPKLAEDQFKVLFKRDPNPYIAYELAELNLQLQNYDQAMTHVEFGLANATADMKKAFYESQRPYQVSLLDAFKYLKAITFLNQNREANLPAVITQLEAILADAPNFRLAALGIEALKAEQSNKAAGK